MDNSEAGRDAVRRTVFIVKLRKIKATGTISQPLRLSFKALGGKNKALIGIADTEPFL